MKKLLTLAIGILGLTWSNSAFCYKSEEGKKPNNSASMLNKGAGCSPATAKITMSFNDVSAIIEQGGSMWQNRATGVAAYEIPKGSGLKVIYAGALWMGGKDDNGQLKLAALRFREGNDFWPGPLAELNIDGNYDPGTPNGAGVVRAHGAATISSDQCLAYDKFYTIRKAEVIRYSTYWEACEGQNADPTDCANVTLPTNDELNRIHAWPAHGDVSLGQDYWLAPFYDNDLDGAYDPEQGDTPWYDDILNRDDIECGVDRRVSLYGDETHWWVFNDKGNIHGESGGDPIGMEVRAQAFAFATNDEVNRMTFYNYELINRGTQTLTDTYFAQYIDADVGGATDDYVGCDVSRGLGYAFNGDNFDDAANGALGYGNNPPAVGCDFFEGPYQDPDGLDNPGPYYDESTQSWVTPSVIDAIANNGIVYKGIGVGYSDGFDDNERYGMRLFTYYNNSQDAAMGDPSNQTQYYNFMSGLWGDGIQMVAGGTGYPGSTGSTNTPSTYMFPGDSDPLNWATQGVDIGWDWNEMDTDGAGSGNEGGDRRFVQSAGPFTLTPGAVNNITVGIVYGRGSDGDLWASVEAMKRADTKAQALFDACFRILEPPSAPKLTIQELENSLVLMLTNPAGSNNINESYAFEDEINIPDNPLYDRNYRFEGYQIYQMANEESSVSDIGSLEANAPRLVAQCDVKNDVIDIINFEFDEALGYSIPVQKVDAENNGIQHSFYITEDEFAQGDRALVNHKTYYYLAVAYAHNDFKTYDPNDPQALDGQKSRYISSRISYDGSSIESVAAIPHNPAPEADGTIWNIAYGSGPLITRLDGYGNGGNAVDLHPSTLNAVVANGYVSQPTFDYGRGPIKVKVVDPLNVAGGYFECLFTDYDETIENAADTASWIINRYDSKGGNVIESVSSDMTIGKEDPNDPLDELVSTDNEQLIPQWGISVQITQKPYYFPEGGSGSLEAKTTDLLEGTIEFEDSSLMWLSGIEDNDAFFPTNWIRSGEYDPTHGTTDTSDDDCTDPASPGYKDYFDPCNYPDELNMDVNKDWAKILGGTVAPHRLVGYQSSYMPMAYYDYPGQSVARSASSLSFLPSVDIVFTSDPNLWTRCPVIELGRDPSLTIGGAEAGQMRKSLSVGRDGTPDGTGTGMGWFPGYAIDVESGARLYMAFGENSFLVTDNGTDMIWNPTNRSYDNNGNPVLGGMHPVYVYSFQQKEKNPYNQATNYTYYNPSTAQFNNQNILYNDMVAAENGDQAKKKEVYGSITWVAYPTLAPTMELLATKATISLRVNKEYKNFSEPGNADGGPNNGKPMYSFNMDEIRTSLGSSDQLTSALDIINIVPNPYYAYSEYERNRLDTRVKITNLPERCTVKIYTVNGKLVRTFKKDSPITSLDWDLNNHKGIPVASGVYLLHVDVPDIGERILKFFGGTRQIDLQGT